MAKQKIITSASSNATKGMQPMKEPQKVMLAISTSTMTFFDIIVTIFQIINSMLMTFGYILLVFQTVYVLNSREPKYINLRHIALKWLVCIFLHLIKQNFSFNHDINSQMTVILLDLLIIAVAYPSRALKAVHLKYFAHKEQQRYQQSVSDPNQYDITFSSKVIISISVWLLTLCKHMVALVMPQHRRPIEDALRNLNTVFIERKCFWSIYNNNNQQGAFEKDKATLRDYLVSGSTVASSTNLTGSGTNFLQGATPRQMRSPKESKDIIKADGEKCSNLIANGFKPIKRVTIRYTISESKLEVVDLDFAKTQTFILEELTQREGNVLQFLVLSPGQKFNEPIYIKFHSARELSNFMRAIQEAEKGF